MKLFISSRWSPWAFLCILKRGFLGCDFELRWWVAWCWCWPIGRRGTIISLLNRRSTVLEVNLSWGSDWHHWSLVFRGVYSILNWQVTILGYLLACWLNRLRPQIAVTVFDFWKIIIFFSEKNRREIFVWRRAHIWRSVGSIVIINFPNLLPSLGDWLGIGEILAVELNLWLFWEVVLSRERTGDLWLVHIMISEMAAADCSCGFIELLHVVSWWIVSELRI